MPVNPIPAGYSSITPYMIMKDAASAIEFYTRAFGAKTRMRLDMPGGKIAHAEIEIGNAVIMLADECPEMGALAPEQAGKSPVGIHLYVENVDEVYKRAIAAGAKERHPVKDQFYGDRSGSLIDPFGHNWHIATHVEDVAQDEVERRAAAMYKENAA